MLGGHFISYCYVDEKWYCISDADVRQVEESDVLGLENAYMIFYEKL